MLISGTRIALSASLASDRSYAARREDELDVSAEYSVLKRNQGQEVERKLKRLF